MGAEYVPVGPDVSVETLIASEPPTASEPIATRGIRAACEVGARVVAAIMLAVLALIVLVIVLAIVIALIGLLASLWYLLYWAATPEASHCSETEASASSYWKADDDCVVDDDVVGMVWANIMVGFICVIWGLVAFFGLCSLRNQSYSDSDCKCDATRVNTIGCLWVGILAVWALQYVMIFVVRVVGLSAMVPLLHIAVIAIVYPIDYYIGELIHPHNTDTENV